MNLKKFAHGGIVSAFVALAACSDSVPGCGSAFVQDMLMQQAKIQYAADVASLKSNHEFELQSATAQADYARAEKAKGIDYILDKYGTAGLVQFSKQIAHAKMLEEHPPDRFVLERLNSVIQSLNQENFAFDRVTTLNTNQSTGAHHCSAELLFAHAKNILSGKITYTVRNTDDGETYIEAIFPQP
ncbi:MAG: hypothetical protein MPK62_12405 [Alphaproteobacteria bacterium]|nr:hypothetical protein [Alphaproteobacteria bacterium]